MSDIENPSGEGTAAPAPQPVDELKNLKAEMNRKLENTNAALQQVLDALKKGTPSAQPAPQPAATKKVSVFEDEDAFASNVVSEAERRIEEKLTRQQQQAAKYQQIVSQIYSEYPEVQDEQGPLMSRAREIYASLPDDEKASALAMKAAVAEAASELGVKPKSKRSRENTDDSFSMPSGSASTSRRSSSRDSDLDQATIEFARLMGRPVDDPEYTKKLKNIAKRTNWKQYK